MNLSWTQLIGVVKTVPLHLERGQASLVVVGKFSEDRSRIVGSTIRGLRFPPGAAMDGYWRRGHDFIAITGHTASLENNSPPLLDTFFDVSVNVHFFQFGDPGRTLGNVETSGFVLRICVVVTLTAR